VPRCHQVACLLGSHNIERNNPVVDLGEKLLERLDECGSPLSRRHGLKSEPDLKNRN
jgi:hypothetical protein